MAVASARSAAASAMFSATPPTSVLCARSGERIFSATGIAQPVRHARPAWRRPRRRCRGRARRTAARASASSGRVGQRMRDGAGGGHRARRLPFQEGADRVRAGFRRAEGGDAGLAQHAQRDIRLRHQEGRDRLAMPGLRRADQPRHRIRRAELRGGADDRQRQVGVRVGRQRGHRGLHLVGARAGQRHVDHAGHDAAGRRPSGPRPRSACGARVSMPATPSASTAMRAAAAGRRHHRHGALARRASGLRPMNSAGASSSASIIVTRAMPLARKKASAAASLPGQRAGVAVGEFRAEGRTAELEGDDRLARGMRAARGLRQQVGAADGFEEQQDRIRVRVVHQQAGDLAGGEVGLVAGADQVREADARAPRRAP